MRERADAYQYNTAFDSQRFVALMAQKGTIGFESRLAQEKTYIRTQIRTDLGERMEIDKSKYTLEISNGKLFAEGDNKPFEESIKNGSRRRMDDWRREAVEVETFRAIQDIMVDPDTQDGSMILEVTPPGVGETNYKKNYLRVFVKSGNKVFGISYFSNLSNPQYRQKIVNLNPNYAELLPENPTDVELKSVPVMVPKHLFSDADSLARYFIQDPVGTPAEQLEKVWIDIAPGVVTSYINTLIEDPEKLYVIETSYGDILDEAELSWQRQDEKVKAETEGEFTIYSSMGSTTYSGTTEMPQIQYVKTTEKKLGGGACGSGSCTTETFASSLIAEITLSGPDGKGPIKVPCPECGASNERPYGGYVMECIACGGKKILPDAIREKIKLTQTASESA